MSHRARTVLIYTLVVLLFLLITLFYTRPLVTEANDHTFDSADSMFNIYVITWTAHTLKTNPLNLFNATIFYPNRYTLAYSDDEFMSSLIALPVLAVTHNGVLGFNFVIIIAFIISALGAYLLVWYLARDRYAAFAAGIIFGFSLYRLAHMPHMQVVSAGFMPLAFLCLHLYTEKKKPVYAFLFSVFTIALFWTAWGSGFFLAFAVLLYLALLIIFKRRRIAAVLRRKALPGESKAAYRWVAFLLAAFLLTGLMLVPFILPYLKAQKLNPEFQRSISEVEYLSADVSDFFVAPQQSLLWGPPTGIMRPDTYTRGNYVERSLFPGLLPYLLAIAGVFYLYRMGRSKRFILWFYMVLLVLAAVMCLGVTLYVFGHRTGIWMPYHLLYDFFPGFKAIRGPTRMFVLVLLSLSVLGGFGVKWLRDRLKGRLDKLAVVLLLVAMLVLMVAEVMPTGIEIKRIVTIPTVYKWLATRQGDAPTAILPMVYEDWTRDYFNTANWKKMINGYSGYIPVTYRHAVEVEKDFPSDEALRFLRQMKVRYVVLEGPRYKPVEFKSMLERVGRVPSLELEYRSGDYYAYSIK